MHNPFKTTVCQFWDGSVLWFHTTWYRHRTNWHMSFWLAIMTELQEHLFWFIYTYVHEVTWGVREGTGRSNMLWLFLACQKHACRSARLCTCRLWLWLHYRQAHMLRDVTNVLCLSQQKKQELELYSIRGSQWMMNLIIASHWILFAVELFLGFHCYWTLDKAYTPWTTRRICFTMIGNWCLFSRLVSHGFSSLSLICDGQIMCGLRMCVGLRIPVSGENPLTD